MNVLNLICTISVITLACVALGIVMFMFVSGIIGLITKKLKGDKISTAIVMLLLTCLIPLLVRAIIYFGFKM